MLRILGLILWLWLVPTLAHASSSALAVTSYPFGSVGISEFAFPDIEFGSSGYFGPNFSIVPEPTAALLLGMGLIALGAQPRSRTLVVFRLSWIGRSTSD